MKLHDNDVEALQLARKLLSVFQGITVGFLKKKDEDDALMSSLRDKVIDLQEKISQVSSFDVHSADKKNAVNELRKQLNEMADENRKLQEKAEELQASLKEAQKGIPVSDRHAAKSDGSSLDLSRDLSFYYNDFKQHVDKNHLTEEDASQLYNLVSYIFKVLKKNKITF